MSQLEQQTGGTATASADAAVASMVFAPRWTVGRLPERNADRGGPRVFLVPSAQERLHQELAAAFLHDEVHPLGDVPPAVLTSAAHLVLATRTSWAEGIRDGDIAAFLDLVHALDKRSDVQFDVFTDKAVSSPLFASAAHPVDGVYVGLAQTLAAERPEWVVRCFCLRDLSAAELSRLLDRALPTVPGKPVCIHGEEYAVPALAPVSFGEQPERSAFKRNGTYVILGGTGGLGGLLAEHLAATYRAGVVLIGRRAAERAEGLLRHLRELGASDAHYHQVDLADGPALKRALDSHHTINGIVHSALVLEDATLATMTAPVLLDVLRPKLHGTHNLLRALRGRDVEFCLFFSSIQSYLASPGQANYTAACVAKDAYADLLRNALLIDTKIINWGYWGHVGVVAKPEYRERMDRLGIGSIEPAEGLAAIERLLGSEHRQITVVKATREALERMDITPHESAAAQPVEGSDLLEAVVPPFAEDTVEATRNRELAHRLEAYARWRLHGITLPPTTIARHAALRKAIRATICLWHGLSAA